jgi:hypothetical protein
MDRHSRLSAKLAWPIDWLLPGSRVVVRSVGSAL